MIKPGYVKIMVGNQVKDLLSYEDLALSMVLRIGTQRRNEQMNARTFCCCKENNPVELYFDELGNMIFTGNTKHTDECIRLMKSVDDALNKSALQSELDRNAPMPVTFRWLAGRSKADFSVITSEDLPFSAALSFSQWILYNNCRQFSSRKSVNSDKLGDTHAHSGDFYFRIGSKRVFISKAPRKEQSSVLFNDKMLFDSAPVGQQDFFYGKILSVDGLDDESKKRVIVRSADKKNRRVSFYIPRLLFLKAYDRLPFADDIWVAGFIKKKEVLAELPEKGMGLGAIDPTKAHVASDIERPKVVVCEMKTGRLFNCNDSGLIVFSKHERDESNRLMRLGYGVYRPVLSKGDISLYRFNADGPDTPI